MEWREKLKQLTAENKRLSEENEFLKQVNGLLKAHNSEIHEHLRDLMYQEEQRGKGAVVQVKIDTVEDLVPMFYGMGYLEKLELHKAATAAGNADVIEFLERQGIGL